MTEVKTSTQVGQTTFLPQEEMLELGKRHKQISIGIPKETVKNETRIPLTPQAVALLVNKGHKVVIESEAGIGANYTDKDYSEAGGVIIRDKEFVYKSEIVLKVSPFSLEEIELLKDNQTIISALHLTTQTEESIRRLIQKRVKAIAFEFIKGEKDTFPIIETISEISGRASIMIAAEYLSTVHKGKGVLLGSVTGITPTEVMIFGAGTAAEYAARAAIGMGAAVKVFDDSTVNLKRLQLNLNHQVITSIYQPKVINKTLKSVDVIISALENYNTLPYFITEDMVRTMKKGAVIIDLNIDHGSCFETSRITSHENPVFEKNGVVHYCVPNIAARVSRTASIALSNVLCPILLNIGQNGGTAGHLKEDAGLRNGIYIYNGILTNFQLSKKFGIDAKDINLLMAAF